MIDPLSASMVAISTGSPSAIALVFFAGTLTSIGPCVAPRYIAVAAIANGYRRPLVPTTAFIGGLIGAYVALGWSAGLLGSIWTISHAIDALLAVVLIGSGCVILVRAVPVHACEHHRSARELSQPATGTPARRSLGAVFLLGAASALVISPCCTPIVASVVATSAAIGKPLFGTILLASFACGHALPLVFVGSFASFAQGRMRRWIPTQAPAIVTGTLMVTLGAYYGVLA